MSKFYDFAMRVLEIIAVLAFIPVLIASYSYGNHTGGYLHGWGISLICIVVFGTMFMTIENNRTLKAIRDLLEKKLD